MSASGTIRIAVGRRLVELIGDLDGFSASVADVQGDQFLVSGPFNGSPPHPRWVVIGVADGPIVPDGIQSGTTPSIDTWTIACGAACTDIEDPDDARQALEDVVNAIADLLAADGRIGLQGPRDLTVSNIAGPFYEWPQSDPPFGWVDFDIAARADIRRNPSP